MDKKEILSAVEAILFAAGDSVEIRRLAAVLGLEPEEILTAAHELALDYERRGAGMRLVQLEESLQLVSAPRWSDEIIRCLEKRRSSKLTPTALEVLGIVAYYQPVTRAYIEKLRGVDSSYTVAFLSERGLIEPCGRLEAPGRPTLFRTTEQFLRVMGISSLDGLPPLPDITTDEGMAALQAAIDAAGGSEQMELQELGV